MVWHPVESYQKQGLNKGNKCTPVNHEFYQFVQRFVRPVNDNQCLPVVCVRD